MQFQQLLFDPALDHSSYHRLASFRVHHRDVCVYWCGLAPGLYKPGQVESCEDVHDSSDVSRVVLLTVNDDFFSRGRGLHQHQMLLLVSDHSSPSHAEPHYICAEDRRVQGLGYEAGENQLELSEILIFFVAFRFKTSPAGRGGGNPSPNVVSKCCKL